MLTHTAQELSDLVKRGSSDDVIIVVPSDEAAAAYVFFKAKEDGHVYCLLNTADEQWMKDFEQMASAILVVEGIEAAYQKLKTFWPDDASVQRMGAIRE